MAFFVMRRRFFASTMARPFAEMVSKALAVSDGPACVALTETEKFAARVLDERQASHGFGHACRVRDLALKIYKEETDADDAKEVEIAALLHDVLDHKYVDLSTESGRRARTELDAFLGEDSSSILAICETVSYSKEKKARDKNLPPPYMALSSRLQFLRHCVSDADKIDAIGETGLKRCVQYRLEIGTHDDPRAIIDDVAKHCDEKLLTLLPNYIMTATGRAIAKPHHDYLQCWFDQATNLLNQNDENKDPYPAGNQKQEKTSFIHNNNSLASSSS